MNQCKNSKRKGKVVTSDSSLQSRTNHTTIASITKDIEYAMFDRIVQVVLCRGPTNSIAKKYKKKCSKTWDLTKTLTKFAYFFLYNKHSEISFAMTQYSQSIDALI